MDTITCATSGKVLASMDNEALYLWCKRCNTTHAFTKQQILQMWNIHLPQQVKVLRKA